MGRVFRPRYKWTRKDGKRVEKRTAAWYVEYADNDGKWIRRKAGLTREDAADVLKKLESDVLAAKHGLPTQCLANMAVRDLADRFLTSMIGRTGDEYRQTMKQRLFDLIVGCGVHKLVDLTPEVVERYLATLAESGLSSRSINYYMNSAKTMFRWAIKARIVPYSPLDSLSSRPIERRHVRRALSEDEIHRLLVAGQDGPRRRLQRRYRTKEISLDLLAQAADRGRNNVLVYRLMLEIGLRLNEVKSAIWADINLDLGTLTTRDFWEGNKNGKEQTLPLTSGLQDALEDWRKRHPALDTEHAVLVTNKTLSAFDDDLVAAGLAKRIAHDEDGKDIPLGKEGWPIKPPAETWVDKRDAAGRVIDLHALRHTFGTRLGGTPGIDPKSVQTLMRHSDARLTFGVYVHSDRGRLAAAVAAMPALDAPKESPVEKKKQA